MDRDGASLSLMPAARQKGFHWRRILPWLAPSLFLAFFFFYPLIKILWTGLNPVAFGSLGAGSFLFSFQVFLFTIYQSLLSVLLTLALGLPAAYLFGRFLF